VVLADGSELAASVVISGLHPAHTLLALCDPGWLDPELARAVRHIRSRRFEKLPSGETLDALERAYDEVKHGRAAVVHGEAELALDQVLWMRPVPELAHYRTPIEGLWLCGESMHPGPGIAGAAGLHCAGEILAAS
jgi:phytoene dehydrogenase-like protein